MNKQLKYRTLRKVHFHRWSNESYAVFGSIGKVIVIGHLSRIVHRLITVKSALFQSISNFLQVLARFKAEVSESDLGDIISLLQAGEVQEDQVLRSNLFAVQSRQSDGVDKKYSFKHMHFIKALLRPFFCCVLFRNHAHFLIKFFKS